MVVAAAAVARRKRTSRQAGVDKNLKLPLRQLRGSGHWVLGVGIAKIRVSFRMFRVA